MSQPFAFAGTSAGHPIIGGPGQLPFRPDTAAPASSTARSVASGRPAAMRLAEAFIGPVALLIPPIEDRTDYKKKAGSSDSYNTYDAIET